MKKVLLSLFILFIFSPIVNAEVVDLAPNAKSAILIEASTGEILYQKNIHEKFAPASMTKMMSMLLIIENIENGNLKWNENIKISSNAASMGGSQIFLEAGEVMTVEDLFKGIAIGSANDATVALAERIAGTQEEFANIMNEKGKLLGLKNSNFKNCHGLDVANHYSSAYDMSLIAKELVKHKKVLEFSSIYETYLREKQEDKFWLVNTNKLVRFYTGVDGLKTGFTEEAGYCLTATANKDNMRLIAVVMGEVDSKVRNAEVSAMLDYAYNLYNAKELFSTKNSVGRMKVNKGTKEYVDMVPVENVKILYKKGTNIKKATYNIEIINSKAPIKKGDIVGKINIIEDNNITRSIGLTIEEDVDKASIFQLYFRYLSDIIKGI